MKNLTSSEKNNKVNISLVQIINKFNNFWAVIYGLMMFVIMAVCIFFPYITFRGKINYLPAIVLLGFGIVFMCGLFLLCNKVDITKKKKNLYLFVSLLIFLTQIYFVWNYYFYTDWDVQWLINLSNIVAHGQNTAEFSEYFSIYPNNLFLAYVFSIIRRIADIVGLYKYEYFAILCVQCLINTVTGFFLILVLDKLFDNTALSILGYIIYFFLVGLSPWISIPYSDSMALLFPILIIYIYINKEKSRFSVIPWLGITVLSIIGYKIKPQILILFIAILMIELINIIKIGLSKNILKNFVAVASGIICVGLITQIAISSMNVTIDKDKSFNIQHFFMMGMNPNDMGVWSQEDVDFSISFETASERNSANMNKALERIKDMGITGLSKQFIRKTLTNYYDGTFGWAGEGTFFSKVLDEKNSLICSFVRGLYYTNSYASIGRYYVLWSNFEQMLWLTILLISIFSIFEPKSTNKDIIMLSIIGLTLFELIFEARSRYLFTYVPLYIILAIYGVRYISTKLKDKQIKL